MSITYRETAGALAKLGYLQQAESQAREAIARDPINTSTHFTLARILDTQGRHQEARAHLQRAGRQGVYGSWFNAVWRHDYAGAERLAETYDAPNATDHYGRLLKPSAVLTSRAFVDPALWPQAIAEMRKFEQENERMNFGLVLAPDASTHAAELIAGLAQARRRSYSSYDLLLWTKDLAYLRRDPAFQDYLRDNGILAYWKKHGFPKQCRPQGDGTLCD